MDCLRQVVTCSRRILRGSEKCLGIVRDWLRAAKVSKSQSMRAGRKARTSMAGIAGPRRWKKRVDRSFPSMVSKKESVLPPPVRSPPV